MKQISILAMLCIAASAHAQSSVTIYGIVDAGVGRTSNANVHTTQMLSGVANGSRLGFRGSEDLGAGMSAVFTLEQGIAVDTGTSTQGGVLFGRQAFVGLTSTTGWTLSAGRQFSPVSNALISVDPFGWQYFGNTLGTGIGLHESAGEGPNTGGFQSTARVNNSLAAAFKRGGFSTAAMVAAGDEDSRGSGRLVSVSGTYSNQALLVTAAMARFRQYAGGLIPAAEPQWQSQYVIGANYDFGVAKVYGGGYHFKPATDNRAASAPSGLNPAFEKSSTYWIGLRIPVANGQVLANVMRSSYAYSSVADGKGVTFGVAYEHYLSKRTAFYANYGQVNNNATGLTPLFAAIPAVIPGSAGADLKGYAIGVRHTF